jgi:hypothetical protein
LLYIPADSGVTHAEADALRLSEVVGLTPAQQKSVVALFDHYYRAANAPYRNEIPGPSWLIIPADIHEQVIAVLTPEQRTKLAAYDYLEFPASVAGIGAAHASIVLHDPAAASSPSPVVRTRAIRATIEEYLQQSPAIAARVGANPTVHTAGGWSWGHGAQPRENEWHGRYRYRITGADRTLTVDVSWEKSATAPLRIFHIATDDGTVIVL